MLKSYSILNFTAFFHVTNDSVVDYVLSFSSLFYLRLVRLFLDAHCCFSLFKIMYICVERTDAFKMMVCFITHLKRVKYLFDKHQVSTCSCGLPVAAS